MGNPIEFIDEKEQSLKDFLKKHLKITIHETRVQTGKKIESNGLLVRLWLDGEVISQDELTILQ